ncbi:tuberin [Anaeramoeba flamelloides]|uniref:Tuberin n=1 Tax=Anaeramoeba flamelloides TaxID=1746091 RepID=A0AAV8AAG2_9EUKA|nr:tuberin [Anaeramoeba flamelloides]
MSKQEQKIQKKKNFFFNEKKKKLQRLKSLQEYLELSNFSDKEQNKFILQNINIVFTLVIDILLGDINEKKQKKKQLKKSDSLFVFRYLEKIIKICRDKIRLKWKFNIFLDLFKNLCSLNNKQEVRSKGIASLLLYVDSLQDSDNYLMISVLESSICFDSFAQNEKVFFKASPNYTEIKEVVKKDRTPNDPAERRKMFLKMLDFITKTNNFSFWFNIFKISFLTTLYPKISLKMGLLDVESKLFDIVNTIKEPENHKLVIASYLELLNSIFVIENLYKFKNVKCKLPLIELFLPIFYNGCFLPYEYSKSTNICYGSICFLFSSYSGPISKVDLAKFYFLLSYGFDFNDQDLSINIYHYSSEIFLKNYFGINGLINSFIESMRFFFDVENKFELKNETVFHSIKILNCFLSISEQFNGIQLYDYWRIITLPIENYILFDNIENLLGKEIKLKNESFSNINEKLKKCKSNEDKLLFENLVKEESINQNNISNDFEKSKKEIKVNKFMITKETIRLRIFEIYSQILIYSGKKITNNINLDKDIKNFLRNFEESEQNILKFFIDEHDNNSSSSKENKKKEERQRFSNDVIVTSLCSLLNLVIIEIHSKKNNLKIINDSILIFLKFSNSYVEKISLIANYCLLSNINEYNLLKKKNLIYKDDENKNTNNDEDAGGGGGGDDDDDDDDGNDDENDDDINQNNDKSNEKDNNYKNDKNNDVDNDEKNDNNKNDNNNKTTTNNVNNSNNNTKGSRRRNSRMFAKNIISRKLKIRFVSEQVSENEYQKYNEITKFEDDLFEKKIDPNMYKVNLKNELVIFFNYLLNKWNNIPAQDGTQIEGSLISTFDDLPNNLISQQIQLNQIRIDKGNPYYDFSNSEFSDNSNSSSIENNAIQLKTHKRKKFPKVQTKDNLINQIGIDYYQYSQIFAYSSTICIFHELPIKQDKRLVRITLRNPTGKFVWDAEIFSKNCKNENNNEINKSLGVGNNENEKKKNENKNGIQNKNENDNKNENNNNENENNETENKNKNEIENDGENKLKKENERVVRGNREIKKKKIKKKDKLNELLNLLDSDGQKENYMINGEIKQKKIRRTSLSSRSITFSEEISSMGTAFSEEFTTEDDKSDFEFYGDGENEEFIEIAKKKIVKIHPEKKTKKFSLLRGVRKKNKKRSMSQDLRTLKKKTNCNTKINTNTNTSTKSRRDHKLDIKGSVELIKKVKECKNLQLKYLKDFKKKKNEDFEDENKNKNKNKKGNGNSSEENIGENKTNNTNYYFNNHDHKFEKNKEYEPVKETPTHFYHFCRLLISQLNLIKPSDMNDFKQLEWNSRVEKYIQQLDVKRSINIHKIGIIYVDKTQKTKNEILQNRKGSVTFQKFISSLGWEIDMFKHSNLKDEFVKQYSPQEGNNSILYFADFENEIIFHVSTKIPNSQTGLNQINQKFKHISNDFINIIWCQDNPYFDPSVLSSNFNFIQILIHTLPNGLFNIKIYTVDGIKIFGPLIDGMIVDSVNLPIIIRNSLIFINNYIYKYFIGNYTSPFQVRKNKIQNIIKKFQKDLPLDQYFSNIYTDENPEITVKKFRHFLGNL